MPGRRVSAPRSISLGDGLGRALVDARAAVDALVGVHDGNVLDGNRAVRAGIGAGAAPDAFPGVDLHCHPRHSVMASDGHASMHAPQSVHFPESMTAMSSTEMAPLGQASAQAPQATQLSETMVGIFLSP